MRPVFFIASEIMGKGHGGVFWAGGPFFFFFLHGLLGLKLVDLASWHESCYVTPPFFIIIHV